MIITLFTIALPEVEGCSIPLRRCSCYCCFGFCIRQSPACQPAIRLVLLLFLFSVLVLLLTTSSATGWQRYYQLGSRCRK